MSQVRTRRPGLSRPVALIFAVVVGLGLSLAGVANAEDFRDRDGGNGAGGYGNLLPGGHRDGPRQGVRPGRSAAGDRGAVRDRGDDPLSDDDRRSADDSDSGDLDKLEPATPAGGLVEGTPCSTKAVACVSLSQKKSWLFTRDEDGAVVVNHGPVPVSTGGPGKETPLGDFVVEWKDKNHKSGEYFVPHGCKPPAAGCEGAPMNWAVFFAEGGIAFHEGTLAIRSSGCVRMSAKEAEFYYNTLSPGDRVEIRS